MKTFTKYSLFAIVLFVCSSHLSNGQMNIGLDMYNRYIWRGIDFGNSPSLQPYISYSTGGLSVGAWGAFSLGSTGSGGRLDMATGELTGNSNTFSENDIWASYAVETSAGVFTLYYTDYFYPYAGIKFFKYEDNGLGAHTLEGGIGYTGTESFPVSLTAYYNFFNDVDKSVYLQVSYPFSVDSVYSLIVFAAGTPAKSAWYAASKAAVINVGVTVSKTIKITEEFSLPVTASYIVNPELEQSYLIFGVSL